MVDLKKFVAIVICIATPAAGEPAPTRPAIVVTGRVIDRLGAPVRGARVSFEGATSSITTDRDGRFTLSVPVGTGLVVEKPGMATGLADVAGPTLDDVVLLDDTSEQIEVQGQAPVDAPGAAVIDRSEIQRLPGTGGDVVKTLSAMPGVVNQQLPVGYSGVVIRGGSPQDSKLFIDDFEIPVLFHTIGFRAVVPTESIDTLEYVPGGFDVAFGRASSGIVQLTTRPGDGKRTEQAEISVIDGGLLVQGASGKTRYMAGFRRSLVDLILPYIIPASVDLSLTTVPSYYDAQVRIDHELSDSWRLSLSSIGSIDTLELYLTKDSDAKSKRLFNRTAFERVTAAATYHDGPWTARLALSGILPQFILEVGELQKIEATQPQVSPRAEIIHYDKSALGLADVEWRIGADAQISKSYLTLALGHEQREGENSAAYDPRDLSESFDGAFWTTDVAQWASIAANLDPRIRAQIGIRADELARNGQVGLQPRGKVELKLTPSITARLTSGLFLRPPEYQSELLQSNLDFERSLQTIVGVGWEPDERTRIQTSFFYTDRTRLITTAADGMTLTNDGRGTTLGAELLATYRSGPWFGWLSYSYSHSTRVDHPGDPTRLFSYDQPHSLNAAVSWRRGKWQLGGRFQLYSSLPFTPVKGSVYDSDRQIYVPLYGDTNSERPPLHHEIDLRLDRSFTVGPAQLTWFIDVQNAYLNQSTTSYVYNFDYSQRAAFTSLPIIPSIGLRGVL